jgi:predicted MPP superfamily phosphohydrolase
LHWGIEYGKLLFADRTREHDAPPVRLSLQSRFKELKLFRLFKNIFRALVLIVLVGVILICYARYIEPHMLKVRDVTITSPRVTANAENLKIAVFGDTHFSDYYTPDDFDKVLEAIDEMKPDMVVFAGDLIDHYNIYSGDVSIISEKLSEIEAPYGKFAIFGNHDYGGGAENKYQSIMETGGFTVLKNQYYAIDKLGIAVIGIDDVLIGYGDPSIASCGRPDYFNIVLAHEPDLVDQVLDYNVDLMISGHTHGRQINLKFFDDYILPPYGKRYINGQYSFDNERESQLFVNSGISMTKLPYRFLSPPELTCITLKNGTND